MDNLDNQPAVRPPESDLQTQFEALRHLVVSLLILMVVVSGTLNIYLLRQYRSVSKEFAGLQQQATPMLAEFQRSGGPLVQDFVKRLAEYGLTHPDFAPILTKYGIKATSTGAPPAGAKSPAPSAAPKK